MRNPTVTVIEDASGVSFLMLGFEGGESRSSIFFTEPETAQEAVDQLPWRYYGAFTRELCRECDDGLCETCEECRWIRRFVWATLIVFVITVPFPVLGLLLMAALGGSVQYFARWWIAGSERREELKRQRAWLGPAIKKIRPFEKANDFRGGLERALELCAA
jgi:hypothetical protein